MSRKRVRASKSKTSHARKRLGGADTKIHVGGIFMSPPQIILTVGDTLISMVGGRKDDFVITTALVPVLSVGTPEPWEFTLSNRKCELRLFNDPGKSKVTLPGTLELVVNKVISARIDLSYEDARRLHDVFFASKIFQKMNVNSPVRVVFTPKNLQSLPSELAVRYKGIKQVIRLLPDSQ